MKNVITLIIGASSEIGAAIAKESAKTQGARLILVTRDENLLLQNIDISPDRLQVFTVANYDAMTIEATVQSFCIPDDSYIHQVFICNGMLHNASIKPEKKLEDFSAAAFSEVLTANTIVPVLWLQHLLPVITGSEVCKVVVLSARVGSISDNRLGGWYSYRASKSALNMMFKSAAIELARRSKNVKLVAFHPGTTDSPLSKPFQKNVPKSKLFTSVFVANRLLTLLEKEICDGKLSYIDWQGETIGW